MNVVAQRLLESRLGHSFAAIRVHTDGEAEELARTLHATAFTVGDDIYFRTGTYDPGSEAGLRLLAHEAAHAVQQEEGPVPGTLGPNNIRIGDPGDPFERAADCAAQRVVSGHATAKLAASPVVTAQRDDEAQSQAGVDATTGSTSESLTVQRSGDEDFPWLDDDPRLQPTPEELAEMDRLRELGHYDQPEMPDPGTELPAGEAAEAEAAASEAAASATEIAVEGAETAAKGGEILEGAEAGVEGAEFLLEGLSAVDLGLLGASGFAGYEGGEAIGEYLIDPYLNRPHAEEIPADELAHEQEQIHDATIANYADTADQSYKDTWAYTINQWLDD